MKPAPFTFHDPGSLDDLIGLLRHKENAKLLAGGQSLMPMLNMRFATPDDVIDLNGVGELSYIDDGADAVEIGAMVRQCALMEASAAGATFPIIPEALAFVGHFQTRNRGTIGGSLCHLDPSAELPCIAAATDATLLVRGPGGAREISMSEWPVTYMTPNIDPDEVLTGLRIPKRSALKGQAFVEFARRHGDFAIVGVACLLSVDDGGTIKQAAIAVAGVDSRPVRLSNVEGALEGQPADASTFEAAGAEARKIEAMSDAYVGAAYRQRLTGVLVERGLAIAAGRAREAS